MENKDILLLQETERRRIAEELHDTTIQDMIHLSQQLELALLYMDKDLIQAKLEVATARKQIKNIINGMRETIYDLRPMAFDDIGWSAAFSRLQDNLSKVDPELEIHFDIDFIDSSDGVTAISIYRIVCEGCQNIIKHSMANNLWVSIKNCKTSINISICDDGVGIEKESEYNHFGLQFMRERVSLLSGNFEISSNSDGTTIHIMIPC